MWLYYNKYSGVFFLRCICRSESGKPFHTVTAESISAAFPACFWETSSSWQVGAFQIMYFCRLFWYWWLCTSAMIKFFGYLSPVVQPAVSHQLITWCCKDWCAGRSLVSAFSTNLRFLIGKRVAPFFKNYCLLWSESESMWIFCFQLCDSSEECTCSLAM